MPRCCSKNTIKPCKNRDGYPFYPSSFPFTGIIYVVYSVGPIVILFTSVTRDDNSTGVGPLSRATRQ